MSNYTFGDAARILGVPPARLREWERRALVERSAIAGSARAFAFSDLVCAKRVRDLLAHGVPMARIRRGAEAARRTLPELDQPTSSMRTWMDGSDRVVIRHGGVLYEPDGQTVLDLAAPEDARPGLSLLRSGIAPANVPSEALVWFERGCRLDTDSATYDAAVRAYRRALSAAPEFADAHCNLGSVLLNQGCHGEARAAFERALVLRPHHLEAHCNLALLFEEEGNCAAAVPHYKRALAVDPGCADIHASLAFVYENLAMPRKARDHWRRYVQLEPSGSWADLARGRLSE